MLNPVHFAELNSRAVIALSGAGWAEFLQGLITQDVESLKQGEIRFAALLGPQGRLLYDLFVTASPDGCWIDCATEHRQALMERLFFYRLRARIDIARSDVRVMACWGGGEAPATDWMVDPRLAALGFRGYGAPAPTNAAQVDEDAFERYRLSLGVPGPADWRPDTIYPIEANFDLLSGIDFAKGCFIGQETTSRMKRRSVAKTRMSPIAFQGAPPGFGSEILAGGLRAGQALSGHADLAMAIVRLDRLHLHPFKLADGRPWRPVPPPWLRATIDRDGA